MTQCCGTCKHATKDGLSKHYQRWLVVCTIADAAVKRAERHHRKLKGLPSSVIGPTECQMCETSDGHHCPCWQAKGAD